MEMDTLLQWAPRGLLAKLQFLFMILEETLMKLWLFLQGIQAQWTLLTSSTMIICPHPKVLWVGPHKRQWLLMRTLGLMGNSRPLNR